MSAPDVFSQGILGNDFLFGSQYSVLCVVARTDWAWERKLYEVQAALTIELLPHSVIFDQILLAAHPIFSQYDLAKDLQE